MKERYKHTFVICAYGDSPYLPECIKSLKKQRELSILKLTTSTPSPYIDGLCSEYGIEYHVREGKPSIGDDWNEALSLAETKFVTIAHQDDIYEPYYTSYVLDRARQSEKITGERPLIIFTDYSELVDGVKYEDRRNLEIKRMLLQPLWRAGAQARVNAKRTAIRLGNAISCPTVTYNIEYIRELLKSVGREDLFLTHFRSNLDWEAWEWLSRYPGAFVYVRKVLMAHRIHEASETTSVIDSNRRTMEDLEMFEKFWPKPVAKLIAGAYKKSEETNQV